MKVKLQKEAFRKSVVAIASGSNSNDSFHVSRWQVSLILLSAAIITAIILAIFLTPRVPTEPSTSRVPTEPLTLSTDPVYIYVKSMGLDTTSDGTGSYQISSDLAQENDGLREALLCADARYEMAANSGPGYAQEIDSGCTMQISSFDADEIKKEIPFSLMNSTYNFKIGYEGKYYTMIMDTGNLND